MLINSYYGVSLCLPSNIIFFNFASHLISCFNCLVYDRLYLIFGWNYTGEQDEVHPELQVD